MSIAWGPINGHLRVGIDYYTVDSGSSTTIKWTVYVQTVGWGFQDTQTMNLSNAVTWTKSYQLSSPNGGTTTLNVGVWTTIVPKATTAQTRTLTARVSDAYNGAVPTMTLSVSIPGTAPNAPDAPSTVTAIRVTDFDAAVSWSQPASAASASGLNAPWTSTEIQRQVGTADFADLSVDGSSGEIDDKTILPNGMYTYRVRGINSVGAGSWGESYPVYTTPATPSNLVAKAVNSTTANLTWTSNSPYATSWVIYDNGKPLYQNTTNVAGDPVGATPMPVTTVSSQGRYEGFPYGSNTADRRVSLWAWRDGLYHADGKGSVIRFVTTDSNGENLSPTWSWNGVNGNGTAAANSYPAPGGLVWDETNQQWIMMVLWVQYTSSSDETVSKRWAQIAVCKSKEPANATWTNVATVDLSKTSWWFGNDLQLDKNGSRWIVAGYGQLTGDSSAYWQEIFLYSDNQGSTWTTAPLVSGLPAQSSWSEPKFRKLADGSWYMLMRYSTTDNATHYARSTDGINWTYGGDAADYTTGSPDFIQLDNGNLIAYLRKPNITISGKAGTYVGSFQAMYSTDNGKTWTLGPAGTFASMNSMLYAAATLGTDGLPMVLYGTEDDALHNTNPATASIYLGTYASDLKGVYAPDPSGAGFTVSNLDPTIKHSFSIQALAASVQSGITPATTSRFLQAPPGAPTDLTPSVLLPQESGISTRLSWNHTSLDTTPQSAFTLQYRPAGTSTWTTVPKTSSTQSYYDIPGGPQPLGSKWEWQVQTWGSDPGASPWSPIATYGVYTAPSLTLTTPKDGDDNYITSDGRVSAAWVFSSTDGATQGGIYVVLEDLSQNTVIDNFMQAGTFSTWISDLVTNGHQYRISIIATDSNAMISPPVEAIFTVRFEPPATPTIDAAWSENGYVRVNYSVDPDAIGAPTTQLNLFRSIEGSDWEEIASTTIQSPSDLTQEYIDVTAPMAGHIRYKAVASSALGATSEATAWVHAPAEQDGYGCGVWLSGGPKFMQLVYLRLVTKQDLTSGRERVANQFAGRTYPVETSKSTIARALAVTATLGPAPECHISNEGPIYVTGAEIEALFDLPGPHLYRDATGRTMYCYLSSVSIGQGWLGQVSFTATQADRGTDAQLLALQPYQTPRLVEVAPGEYGIIGGDLSQVPPGQWTWDDGTTN